MLPKLWVNECSRILVCVDGYKDGVMEGRSYSPWDEGERFESLSQFLVHTEQILDDIGQPQSYTIPRQFEELPPESRTCSDYVPGRGRKATFELRVLFRQHTSWQGILYWQEKNKEQSFRSVLELVLLMDNALRSA